MIPVANCGDFIRTGLRLWEMAVEQIATRLSTPCDALRYRSYVCGRPLPLIRAATATTRIGRAHCDTLIAHTGYRPSP